jgi:hypothetical protein
MIKLAAVAAGALMLTSAQAAEISVAGPDQDGITVVAITGQINAGDDDVFSAKVKGLTRRTAVRSSARVAPFACIGDR